MRRLARVRQLGTSHLVYPGAVHTRLSHALGTLRAAQDLLDVVVDARNSPHPPRRDWFATLGETARAKAVAEATVAARLGALLHDFCHVPFGHTIEDDLGVLTPHDAGVERFERLWQQITPDVREAIDNADGGALKSELRGLILSKEGTDKVCASCGVAGGHAVKHEVRYPFVADIVGNTICADLIDYLRRDHYFCGLPLGIGNRFIDGFYVMDNDHVHYKRRMVVQVTRDGQRRADVLSELVKYLRYRYELSERVLNHHAKTAADAMISKLLDMWTDDLFVEHARKRFGAKVVRSNIASDIEAVRAAVAKAAPAPAMGPSGRASTAGVVAVDELVRREVEALFLTSSDDGLLETLAVTAGRQSVSPRREAVAALAQGVLNRRLYKTVAVAGGQGDRALANKIHDAFGRTEQRRKIELGAMAFAGLPKEWRLVLWIPEPRMRMKVAQVLCDDDGHVVPLSALGENDSDAVLAQHRRLWTVCVYADPDLREISDVTAPDQIRIGRQLDAALSYVRDQMDLGLHRWDGAVIPTVREFAVERVGEVMKLAQRDRAHLTGLKVAALGDAGTADDLLTAVAVAANAQPYGKGKSWTLDQLWST